MSVIKDGYLNINVDSSSTCVTWINIAIPCISLLIQFTISILAVIKMRQHQRISTPLSVCFLMSSLCACSVTVTRVLLDFFREEADDTEKALDDPEMNIRYKITYFISYISFGSFFMCLLCIVILKLYLTFKSSAYQMSLTMIRLFGAVVSMNFVFMFTYCTLMFVFGSTGPFLTVLFFSLPVLYITGCALAVWFFISNLLRVTKAQVISPRNINVAQKDVTLNTIQHRMTDLASKSMMLFVIQIGSTLFITLTVGFALPETIRGPIFPIDVSINLFCAYLQFAFAEKQYQRCCGCCDKRMRNITLNRTKRKIFKHSIEVMQSQAKMHENDG